MCSMIMGPHLIAFTLTLKRRRGPGPKCRPAKVDFRILWRILGPPLTFGKESQYVLFHLPQMRRRRLVSPHGVETTHHGLSIHRLHGFHPRSGPDHDRHRLTFAHRFPFCGYLAPFPALEAMHPLRTYNHPLTHWKKASK